MGVYRELFHDTVFPAMIAFLKTFHAMGRVAWPPCSLDLPCNSLTHSTAVAIFFLFLLDITYLDKRENFQLIFISLGWVVL